MAGGVITRSNHPDALWPGVKKWFGKEYSKWPALWSQMFDENSSDKAWEYIIETTGFGLAAVKAEGESITYDSDSEGAKTTLTHVVRGLGYIVTREEMEDDLYVQVSQARGRSLAFSINTTVETVHANTFNRAFSGSYVGGDGVALISTAHPTLSGNQSNKLTVAADFSEAALEALCIQISNTQNSRGLNINLKGQKLLISTADSFNAERVLKSELRTATANNDINASRSMGVIPGGFLVNPYFTDTDAWFVKTNIPEGSGLVSYWRRKADLERDNDFDTENAKAKSTVRFVNGWGDWRSVFGSEGAG